MRNLTLAILCGCFAVVATGCGDQWVRGVVEACGKHRSPSHWRRRRRFVPIPRKRGELFIDACTVMVGSNR